MCNDLVLQVYSTKSSAINIKSLLRSRFPGLNQRSVVIPGSHGNKPETGSEGAVPARLPVFFAE